MSDSERNEQLGAKKAFACWILCTVAGHAAACGPAPSAPIVRPTIASVAPAAASAAPLPDPCEGAKGVPAGAPWPMAGRCARHTFRATAVGPSDPVVLWKARLGRTPMGEPAIGTGNVLYLGAGSLYTLDAAGRRRTFANEEVLGTPAIGADGAVYVPGRESFFAFSADGTPRWTIAINVGIPGPATTGPDGTIYFATSDGILHAAAPNGTLRWEFEADGKGFEAPTMGPSGDVYFGDEANVYALHPDGTLAWQHPMGKRPTCPPSIGDDGTLYASSKGSLVALGPDGVERWTAETGGGCPAIGPDGTLYVTNKNGLVAISSEGVRRWSAPIGPVSGPPSVDARGTIYAASSDHKLYAVGSDGAVRWTLEVPEPLQGTPVLDARGVLFVKGGLGFWAIGDRGRAPFEVAPPPGAPPLARRGFLTEEELIAPRPGERLCTTVRFVTHLHMPTPLEIMTTRRQFEDARGLVVRVVSTQHGGKDSKSACATIRWDTRDRVTAVEIDDTDADGLADQSERWTYDAEGMLASIEHALGSDGQPEHVDRFEVSAKSAPVGATTGLVAIPERFLQLTPVTDAPDEIPGFEGVMTRSGDDAPRLRRTYDARGWLVKEESWAIGAPATAQPEEVTTFSHDPSGELFEQRRRVSGHEGARVRYRRAAGRLVEISVSGPNPASRETSKYTYDASGKLTSVKRLEERTVLEEITVERSCD